MSKVFRPWDVAEVWLFPASVLRETVREGLDLRAILSEYDEERGYPPYHPGMMTALLLYAYSQGIYSSRRIDRAYDERVDFMAVTGLWIRSRPIPRPCHSRYRPMPVTLRTTIWKGLEEREIDGFVAAGRQKHGTAAPAAGKAKEGSRLAAMAQKIAGRGHDSPYRLRKQTVEPIFGQIKQARGFRQFLLRGLQKVKEEWVLVCAADNLLKLAAFGWTFMIPTVFASNKRSSSAHCQRDRDSCVHPAQKSNSMHGLRFEFRFVTRTGS